ncbi:MAG TPA: FecR family protein [Opitutales bacterium]|nr:FecR family protein [Opitutales bacterium]
MSVRFFRYASITSGLTLIAWLFSPTGLRAADTTAASPFTEAKITETTGDVNITPSSDPTVKLPAKVDETFKAPDTLLTGRRSRAELKAADGTIARVGSNTAFSLEANSRTIHLQQGSILFNSPKGMGGGTIVTNAATATVLGTTIIVSATPNGGFKLLVLEGHASITMPNGQVVTLGPGQMTFVLPAAPGSGGSSGGSGGGTGGTLGPVLNFDLARQTSNSDLVNGFNITLPSDNLIVDATHTQQLQISNGQLTETNLAVVGATSGNQVILVDQSTITAALDASRTNTTGGDKLTRALASSIVLTGDNFDDLNVFSPTISIPVSRLGIPAGLLSNDVLNILGLIAGNITATGNIDFSPFAGSSKLDVLAGNTFSFSGGNVIFNVPAGLSNLRLLANSFNIPANTSITVQSISFNQTLVPLLANPGSGGSHFTSQARPLNTKFTLGSVNALNVTNISINNTLGDVELATLVGNLSITGANISSAMANNNNVGISTLVNNPSRDSQIEIDSRRGNLTLFGLQLNTDALPDETDPDDHDGVFIHTGGAIDARNLFVSLGQFGTSRIGDAKIYAVGNVSVTNSIFDASNVTIVGGNRATVDNSIFPPTQQVDIGAATVVLSNLPFGPNANVTLWSANGELNTDGNIVEGDVNFLANVTYFGDPAADAIDEGITLGITADNPVVKAALAQSVTLPSGNLTGNNFFDQVMFTPANLAPYISGSQEHEPFVFPGGFIVGNLTLNGETETDGISAGLVNNLKLGVSSELYANLTSNFSFFVLGNIAVAGGGNFTASFGNQTGNTSFTVYSLNPIIVANFSASNPTGSFNLISESDIDPAISLTNVTLSATSLNLTSQGDGGISLAGGSLSQSDFNGSIFLNNGNLDAPIAINGSSLNATGSIILGFNSRSSPARGVITITNSSLVSDNYAEFFGGGIAITNSSVISPQAGLQITNSIGGQLNIVNSNLTANDSIYLQDSVFLSNSSLGDVLIQSSSLTSNNSNLNIQGGNSLAVSNSSLRSMYSADLNADAVTVQDSAITVAPANGTLNLGSYITATVVNSTIVAGNVSLSTANISNATLTVNTLNLNNATSISMSSRTINLSNINFPSGSTVNLASSVGRLAPNPNTNAQPIVGYVNFVTNVLYGGSPAQNFVPTAVGGSNTSLTTPIQIHVYQNY